MKIESVAGSLVALIICVVVIALVAIPVIEDSTQGTPYEGSNLVYDYKVIEIDETPTFTWEVNSQTTATVTYGGETDAFQYTSGAWNLVTDKVIVRVSTNNAKTIWDLDNNTMTAIYGTVKLTVTNGSYTLVITPTGESAVTTTGTLSTALIPSNLGEWGHFSTPAVKATLEQPVYFGNFFDNNTKGPSRLVKVTDGETPTSIVDPFRAGNGTVVSAESVTYDIDYEQTGGHQAVGYYTQVESSWTYNNTAYTSTSIDTYAPLDYESTALEDDGIATGTDSMLLAVIPILLIIVAVMVAARILKEA